MSIETDGSVQDRRSAKVRWAGVALTLLGCGHLAGGLAMTAPRDIGSWFSATLWRPDEGVVDMSPAMSGFWLTIGSFGAPVTILGMLLVWLGRHGIVPPRWMAWTLVTWSAIAAVILEPAPWVVGLGAGGLLLSASQRPAPDLRERRDRRGASTGRSPQ